MGTTWVQDMETMMELYETKHSKGRAIWTMCHTLKNMKNLSQHSTEIIFTPMLTTAWSTVTILVNQPGRPSKDECKKEIHCVCLCVWLYLCVISTDVCKRGQNRNYPRWCQLSSVEKREKQKGHHYRHAYMRKKCGWHGQSESSLCYLQIKAALFLPKMNRNCLTPVEITECLAVIKCVWMHNNQKNHLKPKCWNQRLRWF